MTFRPQTRRRSSWRVGAAAAIALVPSLGFLAVMSVAAWKLPAAAAPALLGAGIGAIRTYRTRDKNAVFLAQAFDTESARRRVLFLSTAFGAVGYMILAALGVGVPDPAVSLPWRAFGGFSVGAVAGVLAFFVVAFLYSMAMIVQIWRLLPPRVEAVSDSNSSRGSL